MSAVRKWLRAILSGLQGLALLAPFVLHYFGSHTMGAHRHLKVRGDQYMSGILSSANLTIAAVAVAAIFVLLLCLFFKVIRQRPQRKPLWPWSLLLFLTVALLLVLTLHVVRSLLIFPWLLLCVGILWGLQVLKTLTLTKSGTSCIE